MVNTQDGLLQRAIAKSSTSELHKIEAKRLGVLDEFGLDRAKQFLDEQKKQLAASKAQFVSPGHIGKSQEGHGRNREENRR